VPFKPLSLFLILFFFATTVFFLFRSDIFQVSGLEFEFVRQEQEARPADEALVRQRISEEVLGKSVVFFNPVDVEERIKREFPTVRAIAVTKLFPNRLHINVSIRVPLAQVKTREGEELLVDAEGVLFREAAGERLPVIDLGESFEGVLGEEVGGEGVETYLEILDSLESKGLKTVSIALESDGIKVKLKDKTVIIFSVEKEVPKQIELLAQILKRYKASGQSLKRVDLRFSRPTVVKF